MASKLQIITAMFNDEIDKSTRNYDNWTSFLKTAANNYKYSFKDQLLIYAQKPNATACAEIGVERKNAPMGKQRCVRYCFVGLPGANQRLRYVFDVSTPTLLRV